MSKKSRQEEKKKQQDDKKQQFISELTSLSQKYGLTIGGCGCCGSPWVAEMEPSEKNGSYSLDGHDLRWG